MFSLHSSLLCVFAKKSFVDRKFLLDQHVEMTPSKKGSCALKIDRPAQHLPLPVNKRYIRLIPWKLQNITRASTRSASLQSGGGLLNAERW